MKIKQKLVAGALFVEALLMTVGSLLGAYAVTHPAITAADPPADAKIVSDTYSLQGGFSPTSDNSAYACKAVIHKPTDLGDNTFGSSGSALGKAVQLLGYGNGSNNAVSTMLGETTQKNGSYNNTFKDVGSDVPVLYIDFAGVNQSQNDTLCHQSMFLFRQASTSDNTTFYGFWNTGRYNPDGAWVTALTAKINLTNKTVSFTLPTWNQAYINPSTGQPIPQRTGSFTLNIGDPDSVLTNAAYFPASGGGGSTTGGADCLETANSDSSLSACVNGDHGSDFATFSDAATIFYAGDLYTATGWGNVTDQIVYTLTRPGDSHRLDNGTPYLVMNTQKKEFDINVDQKDNLGELNDIDWALNNSLDPNLRYTLDLYNYNNLTDKNSPAHTTIKARPLGLNQWATYYQQDDAVDLVFKQAGSNEQTYLGTYSRVKGTNTFALAGSNWGGSCANLSTFDFGGSDPAKAPVIFEDGVHVVNPLAATWKPTVKDSGRCDIPNTPNQGIPVVVAVNTVDHAPSTNPVTDGGGGNGPQIDCHVSLFNPLSWFLCPLAAALETVVSGLDDEINNFMDIKAGSGSYDTVKNGACTPADQWCYYYAPWSIMRDLALAASVIFALVAIVSQAFGLEILDAYTLRKVLPRLIIAIIGITLSWPLMMFLINLIDGIGLGVRGLIYHPFNNSNFNTVALGGGGQFISSLFIAGAIGALGFAGLLSFVATAALAVALAFLVLTLRQMVITMLVIFAPLAIVCSILPNTQKVWKLWWDSFSRGLLMFPLIAAFIALGRVFAAVNSKNAGSVNQIIAFTAYFAPYFLIPFTFRLAGGAIATLGGLVNDRGRGAFDRLKKFRGNTVNRNLAAMRSGSRWNPESRFTQLLGGNAVNRVGSHVGAGMRGRFGFGQTGAAARANNASLTMDAAAKESHAFAAQMNNEGAMAALAFGNNEARLRQLRHYQRFNERDEFIGYNEERLQSDMAAARSIGVNRRMQVAAAEALAKSGKVLSSRQEAESLYDTVSGGNAALRGAVKGNYQYTSRGVGRADLGRDNAHESIRELDMGSVGRLKPAAAEHLFGTNAAGESQFHEAMAGASNDAERQHMVDVLFAAQHNPYTSPEQQASIAQTVSTMEGTGFWRQARENYNSKMNRGGTTTPGEAAGGAGGSPPPP